MEPPKIDRRIQRTRKFLNDALMELIVEKGYEATTVQNIIDRANLGRSTFYAHFKDKEHLLLSGLEDVVHSLVHSLRPEKKVPESPSHSLPIVSALPLFRHAQNQYGFHKAMVTGQGTDIIVKRIQKHLSGHILEQIELLKKSGSLKMTEPKVPHAAVAHFIAGSLLTLLTWWLDNNMPHSPEKMDVWFQEMAMPGVRNTLGLS